MPAFTLCRDAGERSFVPGCARRSIITEGRPRLEYDAGRVRRISIGDRTYDFPTGLERFRTGVGDAFPGEAESHRPVHRRCLRERAQERFVFHGESDPRADRAADRADAAMGFLRYASQTTAEVLSQFTSNRELIAVLTGQWGDYGLPPSQSSFGAHALSRIIILKARGIQLEARRKSRGHRAGD